MAEQKILQQNELEVSTLKKYFKDNDQTLLNIRALLFGYETSDTEKEEIKSIFSDPLLFIAFRNKVFPVIGDKNLPIGNLRDFWSNTSQGIMGATKERIMQEIESRAKVFSMLEHSMEVLKDPSAKPVDISYTPNLSEDPYQVGLIARNLFLGAIENGLMQIKIVCGQDTQALEEILKKNKKNSSK